MHKASQSLTWIQDVQTTQVPRDHIKFCKCLSISLFCFCSFGYNCTKVLCISSIKCCSKLSIPPQTTKKEGGESLQCLRQKITKPLVTEICIRFVVICLLLRIATADLFMAAGNGKQEGTCDLAHTSKNNTKKEMADVLFYSWHKNPLLYRKCNLKS